MVVRRRRAGIVLAAAAALVAACSSNTAGSGGGTTGGTSGTGTGEKVKVAFVYVGPVGDAGWTKKHDDGRKELEAAMGDKVQTTFLESVPEGAESEATFERLAREGNKVIFATSFGYMDQIAALEWVHTNIAAFGGDPERVTIIGQSAGGESVLHLMCSPAVGNLFHQAMAMSGGGRHALLDRPMTGDEPSSAFYDAKFAKKQGITGNDAAALEQLRQIDPETVAGKDNVGLLGAKKMLGRSVDGVPMIDGDIVVGAPGDHFLSGDFKQVPLIIGTTAFDLPVHFPPSKLRPFAWFGDDEEAAREAYESPNRFHGPIDFMKALINISSDMTMHEDARFVSHQVAQHGLPAWLYRFTYTAESKRPGSTEQGHSGDLPFLFETLESMYDEDAITDNDRAMAKTYHSYAVNFVKLTKEQQLDVISRTFHQGAVVD